MNAKPIKSIFTRSMGMLLFLVVALSLPITVHAAYASPFVGYWRAIDLDGSNIRLVIGGASNGPFQITWTESYISFCDGGPGIMRGTGLLDDGDANLLNADLYLKCLTIDKSMELDVVFRYHPTTNTLSTRYENGMVTIFSRPTRPQPTPPSLDLRVNYGHNWVESFYEAEHTVWVTVYEDDGTIPKATAELVTEPKDFWGGESGFQTQWFDWNPAQPDIQPYNWVYAWVDNGASAQVQIGDISGTINLEADSIQGKINAPWFSDKVNVECHPWGAPEPQPEMKFDSVFPNNEDSYTCTWAGEWDIQPYQDVGVGYFGADGHWVANAFFARNPRIVASEDGNWFWTTDFDPVTLDLFIYESADEGAVLLWQGNQDADEGGFVFVGYEDHGQDLVPGNYLVVSDGMTEKGLVLETITMEVFDTENEMIAGTAPAGREVLVVAGMAEAETQASIFVTADPLSGAWLADFNSIPFDITEEMRPWSFAQIFDQDGDANEADAPPPPPSPHFTIFLEWEWFDGMDWPDGALVSITVEGKPECEVSQESWGGFFNGGFPEGCDVVVGDMVTFTDGMTNREHTVQNLAITAVDDGANSVSGTADIGTLVYTWVHEYGYDMELTVEDGTWLADYGSMGLDLLPGMCGRAEIRDDYGNATAVDWCIPNPHFTIFPLWEWYDGMDWPDGATVLITVEGKPYCSASKESWGGFFNGGFPAGCDVEVGDIVTFSDGLTIREHTVQNLAITAIDLDEETISGIADADTTVYVWPHDGLFDPLQAIADEFGFWQVDLGDVGYDIQEGASGRSEVRDDMGNATAVDWSLNPRLIVHTEDDWFRAEGFMPNTSLDFWIYDTLGGTLILGSTTAQTDSGGTITHWVGDVVEIVPGNYVIVSDGTSTRDIVLEALTFDVFDTTTGVLQGTAPEPFGRTVSVGIGCWAREDLGMDTPTDGSGAWIADFGAPVPNDFGCVFAWVYDLNGDISEARPEEIIWWDE